MKQKAMKASSMLMLFAVIGVFILSFGLTEKPVQAKVLPIASPTASMPPDVEWEQTYGGPLDSASSLIQTSDGGYALFGRLEIIKCG